MNVRINKLLLFSILAIILGPFIAVRSSHWDKVDKEWREKLEKEGVEVPGLLESVKQTSTNCMCEVSWMTKDGRKMNQSMTLLGHFVKPRLSGIFVSRPDVTVRYVPSDPEIAIVRGGELDNGTGGNSPVVGIVIGVLGLVGLIGYTGNRQRQRRQNGTL
jgi:hypothetical protein